MKTIPIKEAKILHTKVYHTLKPIYNENSRILILGSIPSPKSREQGFYYAHPQNRFWKTLSAVIQKPIPISNEEKTEFLLKNKIALWDVISECEIVGASDSSISNPVPNDINKILKASRVKAVFTTGKKAYSLYNKLCLESTGLPALPLPSTSPANCAVHLNRLIEEYKIILKYL